MHNDTSLCKAMTSLCCTSLLFDYMVSEGNLDGIQLDVDMGICLRRILYNVTSTYNSSGKSYMGKRREVLPLESATPPPCIQKYCSFKNYFIRERKQKEETNTQIHQSRQNLVQVPNRNGGSSLEFFVNFLTRRSDCY